MAVPLISGAGLPHTRPSPAESFDEPSPTVDQEGLDPPEVAGRHDVRESSC